MQKVWTIATFEFLAAVKRTGYLVATFGMPLFVAAYGGVVAIPTYFISQGTHTPSLFGVVDAAGVLNMQGDTDGTRTTRVPEEVRKALEATGQGAALDRAMASSHFVFRPFGSQEEARSALTARSIEGYFVVPADYLQTGAVEAYAPDSFSMSAPESRDAFADLLRRGLLSGRVDPTIGERIAHPLEDTRRFSVSRAGTVTDGGTAASIVRLAIPLAFMVLFLLSILMTSGYLMQGTATEKENKVVEVLLASADPDEILAGKLVGLGGAGLLQISVWLVMALTASLGAVPLLLSLHVDIPWRALAYAAPLFIFAFLFFGSLMLGTGSLGSNMREAQQLAMVWSLTAALPMIMMAVLLNEPHGTVARVMTWLPFTSGPVIVLRASLDPASLAWWEVAGGLVTLIASTWLALRIGARLFRIGLLSSSRPTLKEIVRQARLA